MAKVGRHQIYNDDLAARVCVEIAAGKSLREIAQMDGMPSIPTIFKWVAERPEFAKRYARSKSAQADYMAEEILEIADDSRNDWMDRNGETVPDNEAINRSRLRIDARKWLMAKMMPKKYGEHTDVNVTGTLTLEALVLEATALHDAKAAPKQIEHSDVSDEAG